MDYYFPVRNNSENMKLHSKEVWRSVLHTRLLPEGPGIESGISSLPMDNCCPRGGRKLLIFQVATVNILVFNLNKNLHR